MAGSTNASQAIGVPKTVKTPWTMKTPFYGLVALCLAANLLPACSSHTPSEADEEALRQLINEDFKDAWDANDDEAIAASFTEEADLAFPTSPWIRGKEAVQQAFHRPNRPEGLTINPSISHIRFLAPGLALVDVDAHFTGGRTPQGEPVPDDWDSATMLLRNAGGTWKYEMLRVMPMRQSQQEVNQAIADTWAGFTEHWHAGDLDGFMAYYTEDADNFGAGMPDQTDKQQIREWMSTAFADQRPSNLQFNQESLEVMGPSAYQYGTFSQTWTDKAGNTTDQRGRMMCHLQLGADGVWRFQRCLITPWNEPEN